MRQWAQEAPQHKLDAANTLFELILIKPGNHDGGPEAEARWRRILNAISAEQLDLVGAVRFWSLATRFFIQANDFQEAKKWADKASLAAEMLVSEEGGNNPDFQRSIRFASVLWESEYVNRVLGESTENSDYLSTAYFMRDAEGLLEGLVSMFELAPPMYGAKVLRLSEAGASIARDRGHTRLFVDFRLVQACWHLNRNEHRLVDEILEEIEPLFASLPALDYYERSAEMLKGALSLKRGDVGNGLTRLTQISCNGPIRSCVSKELGRLLHTMGLTPDLDFFKGLSGADVDKFLVTFIPENEERKQFDYVIDDFSYPFQGRPFYSEASLSGRDALERFLKMGLAEFDGDIEAAQAFAPLLANAAIEAEQWSEADWTVRNAPKGPLPDPRLRFVLLGFGAIAQGQFGRIDEATASFQEMIQALDESGQLLQEPFLQYGLAHWAQLEDYETFRTYYRTSASDARLGLRTQAALALHLGSLQKPWTRDLLESAVEKLEEAILLAIPDTVDYGFIALAQARAFGQLGRQSEAVERYAAAVRSLELNGHKSAQVLRDATPTLLTPDDWERIDIP